MYFGNAKIEDTKWNINYDVQYRNYEILSDLNQLLIRGSIQYMPYDNLTLSTGYAFVDTEEYLKPDVPFKETEFFKMQLHNKK